MVRPGVEPATSRPQVQSHTTTLPSHQSSPRGEMAAMYTFFTGTVRTPHTISTVFNVIQSYVQTANGLLILVTPDEMNLSELLQHVRVRRL